mgnify:CR=1 FL=1
MGTITDKLNKLLASKNAIKAAITEKTGEDAGDVMSTYADKILSISGGGSVPSVYTGHADSEGLKAIGWTDEDIAYYQKHGVNWMEEDDEYHKVTDDNKALYGPLTAANISTYKERIVYLPKIDTSGRTSMSNMFSGCRSLIAIPQLDTSKVTSTDGMFYNCLSLISIPQLDTSNVTNMDSMFSGCSSLTAIPMLTTSKVTSMTQMFYNCYSLTTIPQLNTSNVTNMSSMFYGCRSLTAIPMLDTGKVMSMTQMFYNCYSLTTIPQLNTSKVMSIGNVFYNCYSLTHAYLQNVKLTCELKQSTLLSKDSIISLINNEAATSAITIKLASYTYNKWVTDQDVVEALTDHPNVSLASA